MEHVLRGQKIRRCKMEQKEILFMLNVEMPQGNRVFASWNECESIQITYAHQQRARADFLLAKELSC
jgi:hypothetical protein